ncbi:DUF1566 domain-containing protein [Dysgonomonas sp. 521]|uniref:DUF1566 domain-containing protein n=1 Tax=Dysgonomonas sp. 521 TaxID=2302932 RepID=UPI0013D87C57|nr:DUF1566 domain-containing protein [Dysgonomonas sp. 521]NDV95629.1 DUF1566 domain-containing protein [Dysgonomonas sp. 521]
MKTTCTQQSKRRLLPLLLFAMLLFGSGLRAQVTVGDGTAPQNFSILEISAKNTKGGIRLPHLTTAERDALKNGAVNFESDPDRDPDAPFLYEGLTIYNIDTRCVEFYNAEKWISMCAGGEVCPPPAMPGIIRFSTTGPVNKNATFEAQVDALAGITYIWSIPSTFAIVGSNTDNPIKLRAITSGTHSLANIGVTAVNDCGSSSSMRAGGDMIVVNPCETGPAAVNTSKITVTNTNSGTGTAGDPYLVTVGETFTLTYPTGNDVYTWSLSNAGLNYFEIVSQGNGTITLRARSYNVDGAACAANAIQLRASNECDDTAQPVASGKRIKIVSAPVACEEPDAPNITFSPTAVMLGETFVASVPVVADITYTWGVGAGLEIVSTTANTATIKVLTAGNKLLSSVNVTATNDCGKSAIATGSGTLTVTNPANLLPGAGTFTGKACFDVVESNDGGGCGTKASRDAQRTDFADRTVQNPAGTNKDRRPYTGVQVYTFTTSGTVSKLRFAAIDADQSAPVVDHIEYTESWKTANSLSGTYTVTVYYKDDLNTRAANKNRADALKSTIYAIYNDAANGSGTDKMLKLNVSVMDCVCCPGYLAVGGEYTQTTAGYLTFANNSNSVTIAPYFTATGKDVCFYKADAPISGTLGWEYATTGCRNGVSNDTGNTSFIDPEHRPIGGWRLPTIAELMALQNIRDNLVGHPDSAPETMNLGPGYWSSSEVSKTRVWFWSYSTGTAQRQIIENVSAKARCVRSF